MKPDLYLDVDGVMLHFNPIQEYSEEVNVWLLDLLINNRDRFANIYWLSCWTLNANTDQLYLEHELLKVLKAIPLKWKENKTEAINWNRPFIWIEDGITKEERKIFNEKARIGQQVWEIRNKWRI